MRFGDAMASRTDDAARRELAKRGVAVAEATPRRTKPSIADANGQGPPLALQMKIAAFVFGLVLSWIAILVSGFARRRWWKEGRGRQGSELLTWTFVGAVVQVVLFTVLR